MFFSSLGRNPEGGKTREIGFTASFSAPPFFFSFFFALSSLGRLGSLAYIYLSSLVAHTEGAFAVAVGAATRALMGGGRGKDWEMGVFLFGEWI